MTLAIKLIKIILSGMVLLIALLPYINSSDKSGSIESLSSIDPVGITVLVIVFFVAVGFYCSALQRCLSLVSDENRKARPKSVWYMFLLPYNFIEDFFIIINISNSIEAEARRNKKLSEIKEYGMVSGIGWCIAQLFSLAPNIVGQIAGVIGLLLWIFHWRFIHKVNNLLLQKTNKTDRNMSYMLIIHEVQDYYLWKKVFDDASQLRKDAGEISYQVLKYEKDENRIVHFSKWTGHKEARAFFESPRLVQIRKEAGVKSPEFIYLDEIEYGTL